MEKFRQIMKGESPIDYGAEKSKWKISNSPKVEPSKKIKAINSLSAFRPRMEGENSIDYSIAKREFLKDKVQA